MESISKKQIRQVLAFEVFLQILKSLSKNWLCRNKVRPLIYSYWNFQAKGNFQKFRIILPSQEKDLEKVKFSVQQFGLQAYTPEERRKIERDRLIRLGAKAPKKEWKNYKRKIKSIS